MRLRLLDDDDDDEENDIDSRDMINAKFAENDKQKKRPILVHPRLLLLMDMIKGEGLWIIVDGSSGGMVWLTGTTL